MVEGGTGTAVLGFPCVCGIPLLQGSGCARNSFRLGSSVHAGTLGWFPVCCCLPSPHGFRLTEICFSYQKFYVIKEIVSNGQEIIGKASDFEEYLMVCVFKSCDLFLVAWRNGAKRYFNS